MFAHRAPAHPHDESPAGYSSAGCSPALPASASPAGAIMQGVISPGKDFAANGKLSLIPLSQLRGAVPTIFPIFERKRTVNMSQNKSEIPCLSLTFPNLIQLP